MDALMPGDVAGAVMLYGRAPMHVAEGRQ